LAIQLKTPATEFGADRNANGAAIQAMAATSVVPEQKFAPASAARSEAIPSGSHTRLSFASVPDGAEVEVDGISSVVLPRRLTTRRTHDRRQEEGLCRLGKKSAVVGRRRADQSDLENENRSRFLRFANLKDLCGA
jgi:hypothetical protein